MKRNVVLVTGGRDYSDRRIIFLSLTKYHRLEPISLLVQGWARGVDQLAHQWAVENDVPSTGQKYRITHADWTRYGNGAGPLRNRRMFDDTRPDVVIGFHGGNGTADMLRYAEASPLSPLVLRVTKKGLFV